MSCVALPQSWLQKRRELVPPEDLDDPTDVSRFTLLEATEFWAYMHDSIKENLETPNPKVSLIKLQLAQHEDC